VSMLPSYFETADQQLRALNAVGDFFDPVELDLYDASKCAFDPSSSADEVLRCFLTIYNQLASRQWSVFRTRQPGASRWTPEQTFETIKREFAEFPWGGPTLLNFRNSGTCLRLESCLTKMRGIKRKKDFPLMTVSKFLHFYNPELFPIYDNDVIWNKVLNGCFKNDYREFYRREPVPHAIAFGNDSAAWLCYYMLFAGDLLLAAHRTFMQVFKDWLNAQPGAGLPRRRFNPLTLYARAFEYTAVGASRLCCPQLWR
jgi:hypothetical protein